MQEKAEPVIFNLLMESQNVRNCKGPPEITKSDAAMDFLLR